MTLFTEFSRIITEHFKRSSKFRVCFDQPAAFHEISKFVKQSCHYDLKLSFQLPLYVIHLRVENNSRLLWFFCHSTKRLAKNKIGSLCYPIRRKKPNQSRPARKMFPAIRVGNMSIVTLSFAGLVQCIVCDFCNLLWFCFDDTQLTTILWTALVIFLLF